MSQNLFNGKIDLGNFLPMTRAFAELGRLSPDERYGAVHGALHHVLAGDVDIDPKWLKKVASQAKAFEKEFGDKLTPDTLAMLRDLQKAANKPKSRG